PGGRLSTVDPQHRLHRHRRPQAGDRGDEAGGGIELVHSDPLHARGHDPRPHRSGDGHSGPVRGRQQGHGLLPGVRRRTALPGIRRPRGLRLGHQHLVADPGRGSRHDRVRCRRHPLPRRL
ncbi:uncharacterized protein METZ01_LOCUS235968, partial [marine metagenome]